MAEQKHQFQTSKGHQIFLAIMYIAYYCMAAYFLINFIKEGSVVMVIMTLGMSLIITLGITNTWSYKVIIDENSIESKYLRRRKIPFLQIREIGDNGVDYYIISDNNRINIYGQLGDRERLIKILLVKLEKLNHKPKLTFSKGYLKKLKARNSEIIAKYLE